MRTEVVRSDSLINAFIHDGTFHVLRSAIVKERHRIYQPVKDVLANNCTALISRAEFDDNNDIWAHKAFIWEARKMYALCPGSSTDHDCCNKEVTSGRIPISIAG